METLLQCCHASPISFYRHFLIMSQRVRQSARLDSDLKYGEGEPSSPLLKKDVRQSQVPALEQRSRAQRRCPDSERSSRSLLVARDPRGISQTRKLLR